jgi:hypothetical protein
MLLIQLSVIGSRCAITGHEEFSLPVLPKIRLAANGSRRR